MSLIRAWAAKQPKGKLEPFEYDPGPLAAEDVEIAVEHCGICHSDLSVIDNEWMNTKYPMVPGHEVIGRVTALGSAAKGLEVGQRVGVGWNAGSCMHCRPCLSGDQHLCPTAQATILGHYGGFADRMRAHWAWAIPIPEGLSTAEAGPLLCGGVTVFSPLMLNDIRPTDSVGIVGIGGLGHMALKFCRAWGCEVTAFTSSESKADEARSFGAHKVLSSRDSSAIRAAADSLDCVIVTVNVPLDWPAIVGTLKGNGTLHVVGAVLEPIPVSAFDLIGRQRKVTGSPTGSPVRIATMLEFATRHQVLPQTEHYPLEEVNAALDRLRSGKARYRIVLDMPKS